MLGVSLSSFTVSHVTLIIQHRGRATAALRRRVWKTARAKFSTRKCKWSITAAQLQEGAATSSLFASQMRHASQDAALLGPIIIQPKGIQLALFEAGAQICLCTTLALISPSWKPLGGFHFPGAGVLHFKLAHLHEKNVRCVYLCVRVSSGQVDK